MDVHRSRWLRFSHLLCEYQLWNQVTFIVVNTQSQLLKKDKYKFKT